MATLTQSLKLNDGFNPVLNNITQNTNVAIANFKKFKQVTKNTCNIKNFNLANININAMGIGIKEAGERQDEFNDKVAEGEKKSFKLLNVIDAVKKLKSNDKVTKFINSADEYVKSQSKIQQINDNLQTTEELNKKIFKSAGRSRSSYSQMVDTVSKIGSTASGSFSNNDEMIAFSELMTKSFNLAGISANDQSKAMNQLAEGMAKGSIQGNAFNTILQNSPALAQSIADEMGVPLDKLDEVSSKGRITSDVVKSALFKSADDINSQFDQMPMKFSDITTNINDNIAYGLQPAFQAFSDFINSSSAQELFTTIASGLRVCMGAVGEFIDAIALIATFFIDNWSLISPLLFAILIPLLLLKGTTMVLNGIMAISNGIKAVGTTINTALSIANRRAAEATIEQTTAQWGFNSALLACPITWIILAVIVLIALIFLVVNAINHFAGTSISAIGVIWGAICTLGAFIQNLLFGVLELALGMINRLINPYIRFANFIGNVFTNPISSIIYLFQSMADGVLGVLEKIASAMDFIFGTKMADTVSGWRAGLKDMADDVVQEYAPDENYTNIIDELDLSVDDLGLKRADYGKTWNSAYDSGEKFQNSIADKFNFDTGMEDSINDILKDSIDKDLLDNFGNQENPVYTNSTVDNTVDVSSEDLKIMRDIAEMQAIQNFVTLTPTVKVTTGDIHKDVDVNTVVDKITNSLNEEVSANVKGAYNV
ncbi:phage protein [Vallitalea longa]|uniref:Phage protein n=1 Tax=Vallitalea longa TaxID=2936439 RepID=A0A9W6DFY3_9FIRM|nr:tape measure protein [Vallitalea longa]GKX29194.1 phage protein [Vallitalea longa]